MGDAVELTFSVGCATVFAVAGLSKVVGSEPFRYRALGSLEVTVAAALVYGPSRLFALPAALLLSVGFVAYSVAKADQPCRCFGDRFKTASRRSRTARSLGVLALALAGLAARLVVGPSSGGHWHLTAAVVGVLVGAAVIAVPAFASAEIDRKAAAW